MSEATPCFDYRHLKEVWEQFSWLFLAKFNVFPIEAVGSLLVKDLDLFSISRPAGNENMVM